MGAGGRSPSKAARSFWAATYIVMLFVVGYFRGLDAMLAFVMGAAVAYTGAGMWFGCDDCERREMEAEMRAVVKAMTDDPELGKRIRDATRRYFARGERR